jgi:hypothetical protein
LDRRERTISGTVGALRIPGSKDRLHVMNHMNRLSQADSGAFVGSSTARHPDVARTACDNGAEALGLLAPLVSLYVRRASSSAPSRPARSTSEGAVVTDRRDFVRCAVEAVVTIDAECRVVWPIAEHRAAGQRMALHPDGDAVEVMTTDSWAASTSKVDERGRIRIPKGVLRAADLRPGDRLVLARLRRDGSRLLLVRGDRFGVDVVTT